MALAAALFVARSGFCPHAHAEPASFPEPAFATESRWYGWQTLLTDGGAVALPVIVSTFRNEPATTVALCAAAGGFVLGAPIIHLVHRRPGASALSLGLRLALPALALAVLSRPCRGECSEQALVVLLLPAPTVVDATALAWEKRRAVPKVSWAVSPLRFPGGEVGLGVAGRF